MPVIHDFAIVVVFLAGNPGRVMRTGLVLFGLRNSKYSKIGVIQIDRPDSAGRFPQTVGLPTVFVDTFSVFRAVFHGTDPTERILWARFAITASSNRHIPLSVAAPRFRRTVGPSS